MMTGIYYDHPLVVINVNVLCANKLSFDTYIALGVTDVEKRRYKFLFIEEANQLKRGKIKMLEDFPMHPKYEAILGVIVAGSEYIGL